MKWVFLLLFAFVINTGLISAQTVIQPKQVNNTLKGLVYKEETAFEASMHTNGLKIGMIFGELKNYDKTKYYRIEMGYLRDPNERRQNKNIVFPSEGVSSSFTYGKQNSLYLMRGAVGRKKYLSEKTLRKGVAVGYIYEAGLALGILKPYRLKVVIPGTQDLPPELLTISYSEETRDQYLNYDAIFGGTGFFDSLKGTELTVGLHAKLAAHFAFGAFEKNMRAFEAGFMLDVFAKPVPLLVERDNVNNQQFLLNMYVAFQIGRRK